MVKLVDEFCEGCIYLVDMHLDSVKSVCYYIVITGKRRPCKCGKGCTVKRTGEKARPIPFGSN